MNASVSVFSKLGLLFMIALLTLGPVAALAQQPGPANPIDLGVDANQDGLPDELVAEFEMIRTLAEGVSAADDTGQAAIDHAAADLLDRLPYASETRRLQSQVAALQQQLEASGDPATSQALLAEMQTIEAALMDDPAVALTLKTLDSVLASHSGPDAAGLNEQVFLPVITTGASDLTDALTAAADSACTGWDCLAPGHIMLINGGDPLTSFLYAWKWAHSGTYYGDYGESDTNNMVYESNLGGGVELRPLANWQETGSKVWLGKNKVIRSEDDRGCLVQLGSNRGCLWHRRLHARIT